MYWAVSPKGVLASFESRPDCQLGRSHFPAWGHFSHQCCSTDEPPSGRAQGSQARCGWGKRLPLVDFGGGEKSQRDEHRQEVLKRRKSFSLRSGGGS